MKVTLKELLDVPVEDNVRFGIASAVIALHCEAKLRRAQLVSGESVVNRNPDAWEEIWRMYTEWVETRQGDVGLCTVMNNGKFTESTAVALVAQFIVYCSVTCDTKEVIYSLCGGANAKIELNKIERELVKFCFDGRDVMLRILCEQIVNGKKSVISDMEDELYFCVLSHQAFAIVMAPSEKFKEMVDMINKQRKQLQLRQDKISSLESELESARSKPPVIREVKVADTEKEEALYEELQLVQSRLALLEDKLAVYESTTSADEFEIMEECYKEELEHVDLSQYKILIVGNYENKEAYPFPYVECKSDTAVLQKLKYVDYVFFDTRYNSHHTYFSAKNICKANGIKMFHINNRNKDIILQEAKRLISSCR